MHRDNIICFGDWQGDPRGSVTFKGEPVKMTKQQVKICLALIAAKGRALRIDTLTNAMDSDATGNVAQVQILRARRKLLAVANYQPIITVRSFGYAWLKDIEFSTAD